MGLFGLGQDSLDGRSGYERALIMWQFRKARRRGEHVYASGAFSRIPGGRYRLPGVLAETECYEAVDAQNRRFGMIHMPSKHCYTVVLEAHPQGGRTSIRTPWTRRSRTGAQCLPQQE